MIAVRNECSAMLSGLSMPAIQPAGPLVPLEQAHLVQEVGQALQLGLGHRRGLSHVTTLGQRLVQQPHAIVNLLKLPARLR